MSPASDGLRARLGEVRRPLLLVGGVAIALSVVGAVFGPAQFFRSYLLAFLLWLGVPLGSLALLLLQHLTGGAWGLVVRRVLEAATQTTPLLPVLFVPIAVGMPHLYEWTHPDVVAADPILLGKQSYLNTGFFLMRAAFYFAVWIGLSRLLARWSPGAERGDVDDARRLQLLSAVGLVLYGLTVTFASVDWAMSLEPHWFSTVYGLLFMAGQTLTALGFVIPVLLWLAQRPPLADVVTRDHYHDLGNLLLAFVLIWAYLGFSQYLIIWSANLPEEIPWYLARTTGGWEIVGVALIGLHFALPFALLLLRVTKRTRSSLAAVALLILGLRLVDLLWLVRPPFAERLSVHWLDLMTLVGIGALWLALFVRALASRPVWPVGHPELVESAEGGAA